MKRSHMNFLLRHAQGSSAIFKTDDNIHGEILFTPYQQTKVENITISFQGRIRALIEPTSLLTMDRNNEDGIREHVHTHPCIDERR